MKRLVLRVMLVAVCFGLLALTGCGSGSDKSVADTVKDYGKNMAGKEQEVEKKVNESMKEEAKKLIKEENKDQGQTGEESGNGQHE